MSRLSSFWSVCNNFESDLAKNLKKLSNFLLFFKVILILPPVWLSNLGSNLSVNNIVQLDLADKKIVSQDAFNKVLELTEIFKFKYDKFFVRHSASISEFEWFEQPQLDFDDFLLVIVFLSIVDFIIFQFGKIPWYQLQLWLWFKVEKLKSCLFSIFGMQLFQVEMACVGSKITQKTENHNSVKTYVIIVYHGCSNHHSDLEMEAECLTKNLSYLNLDISRTKNGRNKL